MSVSVVVLGGLEPLGFAGVLADAAAVRARGGAPRVVVSCLTAQSPRRFRVEPVSRKVTLAQLEAAAAVGRPGALKTGVVPDRSTWRALKQWARAHGVPLIADPVCVASSGGRLSEMSPRDYAEGNLEGVLLTPNAAEWRQMKTTPEALFARGLTALIIKSVSPGVDRLVTPQGSRRFGGLPLTRNGRRGTGCRFASALATEVAKGATLSHAVGCARRLVRAYLVKPAILQSAEWGF